MYLLSSFLVPSILWSSLKEKCLNLLSADIFEMFLNKLFHLLVKGETQPTSVQSCSKHYPPTFANKWNNLFKNISNMTTDNRLRQFSFKLLHRILVTKKELKRYKIKPDDECFFQKSRFPWTHIPGLLCHWGLLLRNDMVQQQTEIPI